MPPPQQGTGWVLAGQGLVSVPYNGTEPSHCSSETLFFPYNFILSQVAVFPVKFPQFPVYPSLNKFVFACCFVFRAFPQHLLTPQRLSWEPEPGLCSWAVSKPALSSSTPTAWAGGLQTSSLEQLLTVGTPLPLVLKTEMFFSRECGCSWASL